ncbi:MAG TPA: DNA repair protein RadC [Vicinamibacterales bacterium]|nr:DNA repair protein RadC [Vicinamibacterales bacterium]
MKDLSPDDRPREKLLQHGVRALGDNELVALVLGSGYRRSSALGIANELLIRRGGLHGLVRSTCDDLSRVAGIGRAKAAQIAAAVELGRRTLTRAPSARLQMRSPRDVASYLMPAFGSPPTEQLGVVLLDTKHRVMRTAVVAVGALNTTSVIPRDVYREATLGGAASVVVFHNHPSGDPCPSPDDVLLTRRLAAAGALLGIDLMDHIILGETRYCSFKEMGQL